MSALRELLEGFVRDGWAPGAVGLIARPDRVEVQAAGTQDVGGTAPMTRDSIFRIASISKPITAAAVLMLVDDGRLGLDDPIEKWLPELARPMVVRTPDAPVDDLVPARRPITVRDLLDSRAGWGFPADSTLPAVQALVTLQADGRRPQHPPPPDEWLARLARIPLLHQPGAAFLYHTCSDLQGVLLARVSGQPLPDLLAERVFEPLGMTDTGFAVPAVKLDRTTSYYQPDEAGRLELVDPPDGPWSRLPAFPSGAGGLVGTAGDWLAFGRMLLAGGQAGSRRLLSAESVRQMLTDQLTAAQRADATVFLDGQGWGFGGGVDVDPTDEWTVPGRYGWVGGTGTSAHVIPSAGAVTVLLTQRGMTGPASTLRLQEFWRCAARAIR